MRLATVMSLKVFPRRIGTTASNVRDPEERALAQRVARGELDALGSLYDQHHHAVRAFAQRVLGGADQAEDLVQEVFLSAPSALRGFEARSGLRTFLISIAINHARHHRRAVARRLGAMERMHDEPKAESESAAAGQERHALAREMQHLLDALTLDHRVAVVLCIIEERTSGEAAEIVGVPEATVRTRVFHARKKMQDLLRKSSTDTTETPDSERNDHE